MFWGLVKPSFFVHIYILLHGGNKTIFKRNWAGNTGLFKELMVT